MTKYLNEIKTILLLSFPLMLSYIVSYSKNIVDTIMVGNVSKYDLVGLSLTSGVYFIIIVFSLGVITSITPLFSELLAKKNYKEFKNLFFQLTYLSLLFGLVALVIFLIFCIVYSFLPLDQQTKDIAIYSSIIMGFSFIILSLSVVLRVVVISIEKTKVLFYLSIFTFFLNILLNYIFIKYLNWGAIGCTLGTSICFLVDVILLTYYLNKYNKINLYLNIPKPKINDMQNLFKFGIPIGLASCFDEILFVFISFLVTRFGEVSVGSYYIIYGLLSLTLMIPLGLSNIMTHRISLLNSSLDNASLKLSLFSGLVISLFLIINIFIIMTIFENNIINLYSNDKDIRLMVSSLFTITVIYIILDTLVTFTDGVLKGLKYNNYIFKVTTVCGWLIGFSLGHYLSFSYEVIGYLYGISFAYFVMLCLKSYKIYMLIYKKEELEKDLNYDTI